MYKGAGSFQQRKTRSSFSVDRTDKRKRVKGDKPLRNPFSKPRRTRLKEKRRNAIIEEIGGEDVVNELLIMVRNICSEGISHPKAIAQRLNNLGYVCGSEKKQWNTTNVERLLALLVREPAYD